MRRRFENLIFCWLLAIGVVFAFPAQSRLGPAKPILSRHLRLSGAGPRQSHTFLTVYRGDDLRERRGDTRDDQLVPS